MNIFSFLLGNLKSIGLGIWGIFTLYILGKNSKLSKQNDSLKQENLAKEKELAIKKEVLKIEENYKSTSLSAAVNRVLSKRSK